MSSTVRCLVLCVSPVHLSLLHVFNGAARHCHFAQRRWSWNASTTGCSRCFCRAVDAAAILLGLAHLSAGGKNVFHEGKEKRVKFMNKQMKYKIEKHLSTCICIQHVIEYLMVFVKIFVED